VIVDFMLVWLGFFLMLVGVSWARMGPAFQRNRYYKPIFIVGLLCVIGDLSQSQDQSKHIEEFQSLIIDFLPWFLTAFLGYYLVLLGAPTYMKVRYPPLIAGWIIIFISFYLYFEYNNHLSVMDILVSLSTIVGISFSLIYFFFLVRFVENRIPPEGSAPELTDSEKEFVRKIISKNIGGDEK